MHFGEYLVRQKILSAHHIIKALAEQNRRRTYIPLLLVQQGALPDYHALHLCSKADVEHKEFLEVLINDGLISPEQAEVIRTVWMRSGPPLGKVLTEMGFIDAGTCTNALGNFEAFKACERDKEAAEQKRRLKLQQEKEAAKAT